MILKVAILIAFLGFVQLTPIDPGQSGRIESPHLKQHHIQQKYGQEAPEFKLSDYESSFQYPKEKQHLGKQLEQAKKEENVYTPTGSEKEEEWLQQPQWRKQWKEQQNLPEVEEEKEWFYPEQEQKQRPYEEQKLTTPTTISYEQREHKQYPLKKSEKFGKIGTESKQQSIPSEIKQHLQELIKQSSGKLISPKMEG